MNLKWKKANDIKAIIYAPGVGSSNAEMIDGFLLQDRYDAQCRAFIFIENTTNELNLGITLSELQEKLKQYKSRLPGVLLVDKKLDIDDESIIQIVLDEVDNVEKAVQEALLLVLKKSKGMVIGLYSAKGGVGIDTIARLLQLHLKHNRIEAHVFAKEKSYDFGFQVVTPVNMPLKVDQSKTLAECVIVINPTANTSVDRKIFICDQTKVSEEKIKEDGEQYDRIVINRFQNDVIPKKVFERSVDKSDSKEFIYIPEIIKIRIDCMIGKLEEIPNEIRGDLQSIYM
ncbi:hypothetical protein BHU72_14725 [Desulfuribacillus stibiiarsenatis]|uniref:Uncharacterized protein n=1 Tax=Desulfuribacillus stibiiarsenatis TaxID=1390249 RepID=A0A1E5L7L8_9FIRM|nr:hypothetical protein [Desulfuribacillus stibiiarsenatis]OEH86004.1 hypothetical protein BHU72_14725 [Desulfuribacillus stibiiarsenatis]